MVEGGPVEFAAEAHLVAVGEVAAVRKVEAKDGVSDLEHSRIGRGIGLRAGVGLHVGVFGGEDLFGAIAGEVLNHIGVLAAAVIAPAWVALGVFVGKNGAGSLKHRFRDEVFAGDHLQPLVLAEGFLVKSGGNFGVGLGEGERHAVSHRRILAQFRPPITGKAGGDDSVFDRDEVVCPLMCPLF